MGLPLLVMVVLNIGGGCASENPPIQETALDGDGSWLIESALRDAPTENVDVVLDDRPLGIALLVSYEWPNDDRTGVSSFFAEPPIEWPESVRMAAGLAVRVRSHIRPWSIERWFYAERDAQGLPAGEARRSTFCPHDDLDQCGSYDPEAGVLLLAIPDYGETGLVVAQVEWPTPPSTGAVPLVARASWAVELRG